MKTVIKWCVVIGGAIIILVCAVLLAVPFFVDMEQYKPMVEEKVSTATGRPFSINGDIDLSLFPFAGISFAELEIGNPGGFEEKEFVSIRNFEARVKLLPLIFKDVRINRFIIEEPKIVLITRKDGRGNWEMPSKPAVVKPSEKEKDDGKAGGFSLKNLAVGEMAITNGMVRVIDHSKKSRTEISEITAKINEIHLDRPVKLFFSAILDSLPVSLRGEVGPLGRDIGSGDIPVDLLVTALDELKITVNGKILHPMNRPAFNLKVRSEPFSPKKVMMALDRDAEVQTADDSVLKKMVFGMTVEGTADAVSISEGTIVLDDSTLSFVAKIKAFEKPDLSFNATLDQIDADRYLPPAKESEMPVPENKTPAAGEKPDFGSLRSLVLKGNLKAGALKVNNIRMRNVEVTLTGNKGIIRANPLSMDLYDGQVKANAVFNAATDTPKTVFQLNADNIQANGLIKDLLGKDIIEGTLKAKIDLQTAGIDPVAVKKSLKGITNVLFKDGAIKGIDLTAMVRNAKAAFGMAGSGESGQEQSRTDFSEFYLPFVFKNGIAGTTATRLVSPAVRIQAKGQANLVHESLDFRVEPKFVSTIAGQGDTRERSGLMVPVLITGTFSSPKFAPDVGSIIRQGMEGNLSVPGNIKDILGGGETTDDKPGSLEETTKGLLKNLPFGR
jgi:AsmA protein